VAGPVQIILNPENFSEDRENPGGGGLRTDFFLRDDAGFEAHKTALLGQLRLIERELQHQASAFGSVGYVKIILRRKAWAKSHRPIKALFTAPAHLWWEVSTWGKSWWRQRLQP
jgi:hypothetical protein